MSGPPCTLCFELADSHTLGVPDPQSVLWSCHLQLMGE